MHPKITIKRTAFLAAAIILVFIKAISPQETNKYGLYVIDDTKEYNKLVLEDSSKELADLEEIIPGIILEIKYATDDNFLGKKVYNLAKAFLRKDAADSLLKVEKELNSKGLGLKVFDAYRPYSVTVKFYEEYDDTTFVASPWRGSRHNRGCAVDLTIIDIKTGNELDMPTKYDDFTEKAYVNYIELSDDVIRNRELLISTMKKYGFNVYEYEWWHFDFEEWKNYELMDLSFEDLMSAN